MVFWIGVFYIQIRCRSQESFVRCSRCNRTSIHKCHGRNLSALQFRAFSVREVPCRMTDTKGIICRSITCTKTWSAERRLYNRTCCHKVSYRTVFHKFHIHWRTRRIHTKCKCIRTNVFTANDICCRADILKSTAGTSCDDSLLYI